VDGGSAVDNLSPNPSPGVGGALQT
jgi:hypothetical protein